jgi:hypothetical protein
LDARVESAASFEAMADPVRQDMPVRVDCQAVAKRRGSIESQQQATDGDVDNRGGLRATRPIVLKKLDVYEARA